jgi:peptide chain release factor 1
MFDKLDKIARRCAEIEELIADPGIMKDMRRYRELMQEHAYTRGITDLYDLYRKRERELAETRNLLESEKDHTMKEMIREELAGLQEKQESLLSELKTALIPRDPLDQKNIIMEIRAGTGGEEAALFAADLFRMYSRFSEERGWKIEIMSMSPTEIGGFKEIIYSVSGSNVYENMRYESGVHRVQRVPETESGGRIHTSAVTVAVLPEAEETDIRIDPDDLKIDVFRSSGPGGQSVNTTDSAVRVTHIPTGLVVICQDEKSQLKNKNKAIRVLRSRLYDIEETRKNAERAAARKSQIGTGDRSERIRTYNFPQNRVTDHRINLTLYRLESVLQGNLSEIIEALKLSAREESLKTGGSGQKS